MTRRSGTTGDLAELGQPTAQLNLAIMYANGEGTRASELNAYAWAMLAAESGVVQARQLAEKLRPELAPGSEKLADDIRAMFGRQALDARLMRQLAAEAGASALETSRCHPAKVAQPDYPQEARRRGVQGMVYAEFTLRPDGTARNPRIMFALPLNEFDRAVRGSLLHSRFASRATAAGSTHCAIAYDFTLTGTSAPEYPGLQAFVAKTRHDAEAGDANAQTLYGMLLQGVPQLKKPRSEGMPWFIKAAEQDQPDAEVTLASFSLRGKPDVEALKRARTWLERAVKRNHRDAKLYLAALLATAPYAEERDPERSLALEERLASYEARRPWLGDLLEM